MGTRIYNSELTKELIEGARIQSSSDSTPSEIADKVVPVMEVNPKLLKYSNTVNFFTSTTTAGTTTLRAADSGKDFFITGLNMSLMKDVVCDNATGNVSVTITIDGNSKTLISLPLITLTAQTLLREIMLPYPIKIDRNTAVTFSSTAFTAGVCLRSYTLYGYTVDNPNA